MVNCESGANTLLDQSPPILIEHLKAALVVWDVSERSLFVISITENCKGEYGGPWHIHAYIGWGTPHL